MSIMKKNPIDGNKVTTGKALRAVFELAERVRAHTKRMKLHRARMRAMDVHGPITMEGIEHLNRIIAGEA